MGSTLSNGYVKPVSGDRGTSGFYTPQENNWQRVNDHNHDGVNSEQLSAASIVGVTDTISAAGWQSVGNGRYRQLVTMPAALTYDDYVAHFRLASSGDYINPTVEKVSANTFYVYINDNSLALSVVYTN